MIVRKAGNPWLTSEKSIDITDDIINSPMIINAGAVAAGTIRKIGAKNKASINITAVLTDVKPVRPPAVTPAALSTKAVLGLVPKEALIQFLKHLLKGLYESVENRRFRQLILLFEITPINVPTESKRLTIKNVNTTISISKLKT